MACLDTNVLLDISNPKARDRSAALALIEGIEQRGETLCTTRFNVAELYVGIERSAHREREAARVASALDGLVVLEFEDRSAGVFGQIKGHLLRLGRPVGDMDILIASVAMSNGQALVTRNPRHFADMPGIKVLSYSP